MRDMWWLALKALGVVAVVAAILVGLYFAHVAYEKWRADIYFDRFEERQHGK